MELWQEVLVNKWERLNNPEIMGYEVARKAGEIADFFRNICLLCYDTYTTDKFSGYVEGLIRGYQCNEQIYDDIHIATTYDLHNVTCTSYGLSDFDDYLCQLWSDYFTYALDHGI